MTALALAVGSYAVVRETRLDDSTSRALDQARFNLVLAQDVGDDDPDELLAALERRGAFDTVGVRGRETFSSSVSLGAEQVPGGRRAARRAGPARVQARECR